MTNFKFPYKINVPNFRGKYIVYMYVPYSLDQMPLSISGRSRIVAAPPEVLNEIVTALE